MKRFTSLFILLLSLLLLSPGWARLGGGQSYSSSRSSSSSSSRSYSSSSSSGSRSYSSGSSGRSYGSSSSYSGGGSSAGAVSFLAIIVMLFTLLLFVGGPVLTIMVLSKLLRAAGLDQMVSLLNVSGDGFGPRKLSVNLTPTAPRVSPLTLIKSRDPNFSEPAFRAFAHLLFSRLHNARGTDMASLRAYFSPSILKQLSAAAPVKNVVVGASRYLPARRPMGSSSDIIELEFEATYGNETQESYTVERWTLRRRSGVLSKDPESLLNLGCPNCGNSGEMSPQGQCPYCDKIVNNGAFNWMVENREVLEVVPKPPLNLQPGGVEAGTDGFTVYPDTFDADRRAFMARRPDFVWGDFAQRAHGIFMALQKAWSDGDFEQARPFETDTLYDTHRFWIERYKAEGLKNSLSDIQVDRMEACRYDHDAFYDIITLRIFASMIDVTIDSAGQVVSGDPHTPRRFSEYWTFIRRVGGRSGPVKTDISGCPNCGAPLQISQAGVCEYCQAKITSGEFDWTLSSIDQDESYTVD